MRNGTQTTIIVVINKFIEIFLVIRFSFREDTAIFIVVIPLEKK